MLALEFYEAQICSGCGFHKSLTHDKAEHFTFEHDVCLVCKGAAQQDRAQAQHDEAHDKRLGENASPLAARAADGRTTFVRRLSPDEVEALRTKS